MRPVCVPVTDDLDKRFFLYIEGLDRVARCKVTLASMSIPCLYEGRVRAGTRALTNIRILWEPIFPSFFQQWMQIDHVRMTCKFVIPYVIATDMV
jgi:hypothetical protein